MLTYIVITVVAACAVLAVFISKQPDEFRVTRSMVINAPAENVFEQVNNLELGQKWSPWVEMDPDAIYRFEGPKSGVGATLHWEGKKSGKGTMTIIESTPNSLVKSRLEFFKPMTATNIAEFALEAHESTTTVSWTMYGPNNFMSKAVSLFMNCEKMVGDQFSQGLSNLKTLLENNK